VDFLLFLPLCLCEDLDVEEPAAGALAEDPVVELGVSAAIAAAAMPKDNRAEAINLIMGSPTKGFYERCREYARSGEIIRHEDHFTILRAAPYPREAAQAYGASTRAR
jgi:hypothetical protein